MLQAIRDRITGIIAWVIVGLISVTFVLWGIDWYLKQDSKVYAAKVNGVEIGTDQYRLGLRQQANRLQAMLGDRFDRSMVTSNEFKRAVMNRLVEEELLLQAADDYGMSISDAYLGARIHADDNFQVDGEFSPERYKNLLAQQGMSPALYEHQLRRSMLVNQLVNSISASSIVTDAAVEQDLRLQNQTRKIAYLRLPAAEQREQVSVSEEEIAAYYKDHSSEFVEPQRVKLNYLELSLDDLRDDVKVDEAQLKQMYETEKKKLAGEEQRRARHILIQVGEDASAAEVAAARDKAQSIYKQLQEGADFAELAKAESDDPGSAAKGGDLGYFGKDFMVPEFEEAAFSLKQGEISEPVRTPFGFHIIQVTGVRKEEVPSFEEMHDKLYHEATQAEAESRFYEVADRLSAMTFEIPDSLQPAADELGLKVKTSDWITEQGGPGIGQYGRVVAAAFSEDVLEGGNNSQILELEPNHVMVVRVAEHQAAQPLPLEAVRDQIRDQIKQAKAREQVKAQGEALLSRLEGEATIEQLAEEAGVELNTPEAIRRNDSKVGREIATKAFSLPRRTDGKAAHTGFTTSNGDYILLELRAVEPGNTEGVNKDQRLAFRRNLMQLYGSIETQALVDQLKADAEVEINEQLIEE